MDWLQQSAEQEIQSFLEEHPDYSVDAHQPGYRGGTNYITFGKCCNREIVFKYFNAGERWENEWFCLNHFSPTHLVPEIYASVPKRLIIMSRLAGHGLGKCHLDENQKQRLSEEFGHALATFARLPLPEITNDYSPIRDFSILFWRDDLQQTLLYYLERCRRIHRMVPAYQDPFLGESLHLVEKQLDSINKQVRILYHEDISNCMVQDDRFIGFYDLEMCRLGTPAMQLGVAVDLCSPGWLDWKSLITAYQEGIGCQFSEDDFVSILAMNHFYHLIRICRWGWWDGDPADEEQMQASVADADWYLDKMKEACKVMSEHVDLAHWFPGLS